VPALGELLNPFAGAVQNESDHNVNLQFNFARQGPIEIVFDQRSVPHIFAQNQKDMFFTQGYITAANRLWQMDFLSYVSAGRLSEILGEDFLSYDRRQRRMGILTSAKTSLKFIESNYETKQALDNYTEGVNQYIRGLTEGALPLEYKLLNYKPEPWTNLKSVLIMKYMAATLSGYEEDLASSYLRAVLGKNDFGKLFSSFLISDKEKKFSISLIRDSSCSKAPVNFSFLESSPIVNSTFNPSLGSNSWALAPNKTASGSTILCNDPHLNFSFPAIWYELQLQSDQTNVYGYSIPGTPGVIIGYNQNISWGLTNGSVDVRDLYKLELKSDYSQYKIDGLWKNTSSTIEEIKVKNDKTFFDTVFYTVHGPISNDLSFGPREQVGIATKWTLFDASNEFLTFIKLNKASNYSEFEEAIENYQCPVQNFTYADVNGNIAMHLQGKIFNSKQNGNTNLILDGTKSELLPNLNSVKLPAVYNPDQGFVCSANNNPFRIKDSFFINGHYSELRFNRIKQLLSKTDKLGVEDMKFIQLDNTNHLAELAVPVLMSFIPENRSIYATKLREWDFKYNRETDIPAIFERWWSLIKVNTWDEIRRFHKVNKMPDDLVLLDLINNDPKNIYFDILSTDKVETASDIIRLSFENLLQGFFLPMKWEEYNKVNIMHLSNISAFSRKKIGSEGHPNAINAVSSNWGPSLRLIVEMSKKPQGYGIYGGGQSGNPASKDYQSFVDEWMRGKYYKLEFFQSLEEAASKANYRWSIINK
jgi:penicillin amidase